MKQLLGQHSTVGKQSFWALSLGWRLQSLSFQSMKLHHLFSLCVSSGYPGQETCLPSVLSSDLPPDICAVIAPWTCCVLWNLCLFFFSRCSLYLDYVSPLFHSCTFQLSFMVLFRGHVLCEAFTDSTHFSSPKVVPIYIILVICRTVICDVFLFPCIISSFKDQIIQFFIPEHQVLWWCW